ncbi:ABC transporter permease [Thermodesulfobacteriota bacterium]
MINWQGMFTLFRKELWRFIKVSIQTILTPVITVLLYLLVFSSVLSDKIEVYEGINYVKFLIPGLMIMSMIQNAFANSSSSLFQSKQNRNIIFMLLAPLSDMEFYTSYVAASIIRGLMVGMGVWIASLLFSSLWPQNPWILFVFGFLGCGILGALGLIGAICAEKYDHIAAFQNFVILPLSFLSGVFFSIHSLPPFWESVSYYNPFFYMVDGFRYGFLGVSETSPVYSLVIVTFFFTFVSVTCLLILRSGYKMRR